MANVSVYNMDGQSVGTIDLTDAIFGVEVNEHLLHKARVTILSNNRQGTQKQQKFLVVEESHGDKKEQEMLVKVLSELHNGRAAV